MIIGLCGFRGSGKDTVGAYLIKQHGYERRAFADPLKKSIANLFGIPFSEVDRMKSDESYRVTISIGYEHSIQTVTPNVNLSWREFLQRYGTEAHRDVPEMGNDFWVDLTLPHNGYYINRDIVVTDVRFENEARRIEYLGGIIVQVKRPGIDNKDPHSSEKLEGLTPHFIIFNDGGLDELYENTERMLGRFSIV